MVETVEATVAASTRQVGGAGTPTEAANAASTATDATPRSVELRQEWRTVSATATQLQTTGSW